MYQRISPMRDLALLSSLAWLAMTIPAIAQQLSNSSPRAANPDVSAERNQHEHGQATAGWQFMQDGIVFGEFNHQGSGRGGNEFIVPNWWMGMASRETSRGRIAFTGMLSLDPVTVGKAGYREIFQVGEALNERPLVDRQHPHDLFMQLAGSWRVALSDATGFTIAAAPVGEAALGPVAFMHRPSAAENPTAPLGHHTFDSTHLAFGVVTAAVDHGPWIVEGSLFNGREPDDNRWDFDFGALDSLSGRVWFRAGERWEFQASRARLREPEELEPGNVTRTTASATWFRRQGSDFSAVTIGYGRNDKGKNSFSGVFAEGTTHVGFNSLYGRLEVQQVESSVLLRSASLTGISPPLTCPSAVHCVGDGEGRDTVLAFTIGGVRDFLRRRRVELGLGADVSIYRAPDALRPVYGSTPLSFHVFLRLRPPAPMGRMWNMRMSQPMRSHNMTTAHSMP